MRKDASPARAKSSNGDRAFEDAVVGCVAWLRNHPAPASKRGPKANLSLEVATVPRSPTPRVATVSSTRPSGSLALPHRTPTSVLTTTQLAAGKSAPTLGPKSHAWPVAKAFASAAAESDVDLQPEASGRAAGGRCELRASG